MQPYSHAVSVLAAVTYWLRRSRCGPPGRCAITDGSSRCCRKRWASGLGDGRPMAGGPRSAAMQSPRRQPRGLYPELAGVCADVVTESASICVYAERHMGEHKHRAKCRAVDVVVPS